MDRPMAPSGAASNRGPPSSSLKASTTAQVYYEAFTRFLEDHLAKDQTLTQRSSAKDKLTRLTRQQFQELSTDVYDELMRRSNKPDEIPFLPVRNDFHPKRNQARQKLATLPKVRFQDLASDVYFELQRRHPELKTPYKNTSHSPSEQATPNQSQTENIVPVKGTINVENVNPYANASQSLTQEKRDPNGTSASSISSNQNGYPQRPSDLPPRNPQDPSASKISSNYSIDKGGENNKNFQSLDNLMVDLGNMISKEPYSASNTMTKSEKMEKVEQERKSERTTTSSNAVSSFSGYDNSMTEFERVRADYELRIATMRKRIGQLESRLAENTGGKTTDVVKMQQLEDQLAQQKHQYQQQTVKLSKLQADFDKLQEDYNNQMEVANDIRQELTALLEEIKDLSRHNEEMAAEREQQESTIRTLTQQNKEWKSKYESLKIELRGLRCTNSFIYEAPRTDMVRDGYLVPSQNGVVDYARVIAYQLAVDELLCAGRTHTPTNVLLAMKSIVTACKAITEEVEAYEENHSLAMSEGLAQCKARLSAALTHLMSAARNHATGAGLFPVILLDRAAEHLTAAVAEMVKSVGLRRSPSHDDVAEEMGGRAGEERSPASSPTDSQGSVVSPRTPNVGNGVWAPPEIERVRGKLEREQRNVPETGRGFF
ncbi:uncharacterized protein VTP21DRAFT_4927 [Calcarisporiella thermophila]|uniref:uncharacterized protein n=1 Tax=Calcarisporiella thermophila TaxID=911321 RepID=UPI0037429610